MNAVILVILLLGILLLLCAALAATPDRRRGRGTAVDLAPDPGTSMFDVLFAAAESPPARHVEDSDDVPSYESSMDAGEFHVEADEAGGVSWWSSDDSSCSDSDDDSDDCWDDN